MSNLFFFPSKFSFSGSSSHLGRLRLDYCNSFYAAILKDLIKRVLWLGGGCAHPERMVSGCLPFRRSAALMLYLWFTPQNTRFQISLLAHKGLMVWIQRCVPEVWVLTVTYARRAKSRVAIIRKGEWGNSFYFIQVVFFPIKGVGSTLLSDLG